MTLFYFRKRRLTRPREHTEVAVGSIHEYLTGISKQVRNGTTKLEDFIVYRVSKLSRSTQPRKFLITATPKTTLTKFGERGRSSEWFGGHYSPLFQLCTDELDYEHYLSQKLLPPSSLCATLSKEPIELGW